MLSSGTHRSAGSFACPPICQHAHPAVSSDRGQQGILEQGELRLSAQDWAERLRHGYQAEF